MDQDSITAIGRTGLDLGAVRYAARTMARRFGVAYAVPVDHGSTAIRASIRALRLERGRSRSVGAPCNVWRGVYSAIAFSGASKLTLLDVDPVTGVLDASCCGDADTVVAVDGYGVRSNIQELRRSGRAVVEDASLSQMPSRDSDGHLSADLCAMSLQSNKLLSCGEGGVVLTDDDGLAAAVEALVCDGRRWLETLEDDPIQVGFNGMMSDSTGRLLLAAIERIDAYLMYVASGASIVEQQVPEAIPKWVDANLCSTGNIFALPSLSSETGSLRSLPIGLASPPGAPPDALAASLRALPLESLELAQSYEGANEFADSVSLSPHWVLSELGRSATR